MRLTQAHCNECTKDELCREARESKLACCVCQKMEDLYRMIRMHQWLHQNKYGKSNDA